jgi:hypothetical protein
VYVAPMAVYMAAVYVDVAVYVAAVYVAPMASRLQTSKLSCADADHVYHVCLGSCACVCLVCVCAVQEIVTAGSATRSSALMTC